MTLTKTLFKNLLNLEDPEKIDIEMGFFLALRNSF